MHDSHVPWRAYADAEFSQCRQLGGIGAVLVGAMLKMPLFVDDEAGDELQYFGIAAALCPRESVDVHVAEGRHGGNHVDDTVALGWRDERGRVRGRKSW